MNESQSTSGVNISTAALPAKGVHTILLVVLSLVLCLGGVLAARGNGLPPAVYFIAAFIVFPLLARGIGRLFQKRRLAEMGVLLLCGLGCTVVAWRSSRVAPRDVFIHVFNIPPPPSANVMEARRQFFDGNIWLLRCDLSENDFQALVASARLKKVEMGETDPESAKQTMERYWRMDIVQWSAIAYDFWPRAMPAGEFELYHSVDQASTGDVRATIIFRDKATGRSWIVKLD